MGLWLTTLISRPAFAQRFAPNAECIVGSSRVIEKQLQNDNDPFISYWRNLPPSQTGYGKSGSQTKCLFYSDQQGDASSANRLCTDMNKNLLPQKFIRLACFEKGVEEMQGLDGHIYCANGKPGSGKRSDDMCITKNYVGYLHWLMNQVLSCVTPPGDPVDAELIFSKILQESSLSAFLSSTDAKGLMQVTAPARNNFKIDGKAYPYLMERLEQNKNSCPIYNQLSALATEGVPRGDTTCSYSYIGKGLARTLLHGIGLYLYYRDGYEPNYSVTALLAEKGYTAESRPKDYREIRDLLGLLAYNAPGVMKSALNRLPSAKSKAFKEFDAGKLRAQLRGVPYFSQVMGRRKEFLNKHPELSNGQPAQQPCTEQ